jgi:hypothetical protein
MLPIHLVGWVLMRPARPRWGSYQQGPGQFGKLLIKQISKPDWPEGHAIKGWISTQRRIAYGWKPTPMGSA